MVQQIRVETLAERMRAGEPVYLVDVRQPWEHDLCALPGSVLIPLPELPGRLDEVRPPEGAAVVVYCHHGIRSLSGASILEQAGVSPAYSLAGGVEAWHVWLALALSPGTAAGIAASGWLARRVDAGWLRPAVLMFAALTAVVAIGRGLA